MPLVLLLLTALLAACAPAVPAARPVVQRTPNDLAALPEARSAVAGAMWRARVVVAGGLRSDGSRSARVDAFDVRDGAWERLPDLPEPRDALALVVRGERLLALGGNGGTGATGTVWSLGSGELQWRSEPSLPSPRAAMAAGVVHGQVVVAGGVSASTPLRTSLVLDGGEWRAGPELPAPRAGAGGALRGGRLLVVGGRTSGGVPGDAEVVSWAPGSAQWREEPPLPARRDGAGAAGTSGGIPCAAGGERMGGSVADVVCLLDGRWTTVGRLRVARHGAAVVAEGRQLHVIGGATGSGATAAHEVLTTH